MRIAITGGGGELGRTLIPYLLEQGHSAVAIDRAQPSLNAASFPRPEFIVADTRDFGQTVASMRGCDALIHLAAHRSPRNHPDHVVYGDNTLSSYNVLSAAAILGIKRVCLASSINAIGGAFSRAPRYDYFPIDERHPTYAEDAYSLSKWVLEQQADAFARRFEWMAIASLRFHMLVESRAIAAERTRQFEAGATRHLWAYTGLRSASEACLLALGADFSGHEVFYIVAPETVAPQPSLDLAREHYPGTAIRGDLSGHAAFFDSSKAERMLGWRHQD
ncbi:MAG TPA: NAD(P)-dependent oxidoreductase [Roseiflexaceae bacterium]|nr:NAD(P)-dependent oxidoreductase [Roseiflexaceae bacterium]